jgi:hypothetical protein
MNDDDLDELKAHLATVVRREGFSFCPEFNLGPMLGFLKMAFSTQNTDTLCKNWIICNIGIQDKTPIFFAENSRKSLKLVIITLTSGLLFD